MRYSTRIWSIECAIDDYAAKHNVQAIQIKWRLFQGHYELWHVEMNAPTY